MSNKNNFFSEVENELIEEELEPFKNREVTSIYDIAYIYGSMSMLSDYAEFKNKLDIDFKKKNFYCLTPNLKTKDVTDEQGDNLLIIKLDFSDTENPKYSGYKFKNPSVKDIVKSGYCRPANKSSQNCAHSMSQKTSGSGYNLFNEDNDEEDENNEELIDKNISNNLVKWYQESGYSSDEESTLIKGLESIHSTNNKEDDEEEDEIEVVEDIRNDKDLKISIEQRGDSFMGIVTFKIKTEPNGEYRDLLDFEEHNEITYHRKMKNRFKGYSDAQNTYRNDFSNTFIQNKDKGATGVVPGTPLNYKTFKQQGFFSNYDGSKEAQKLPLTLDTALRVSSGKDIIEQFNVNLGSIDSEVINKIYKIPYIKDITVEGYKYLYGKYNEYVESDLGLNSFIFEKIETDIYNKYDVDYYMSYVYPKQNSSYKLLNEEPSLNKIIDKKVTDNHCRILTSTNVSLLKHTTGRKNEGLEEDLFFETEEDITKVLNSRGRPPRLAYFFETFPINLDEDLELSPSDPKIKAYVRLYRGKPLDYEFLVGNYTRRLSEIEGESNNFPFTLVTKQYIQLATLSKSKLVSGKTLYNINLIKNDMSGEQKAIEKFINSHEALKNSYGRRGAFLLGGLVGNLSAYQTADKVSTKMYDKYPSNYITKMNISEIIGSGSDKLYEYLSKENRAGNLEKGRNYLLKLNEIISNKKPDEWDVSVSDLRMHYSLGITFGFEEFFSSQEGDNNE